MTATIEIYFGFGVATPKGQEGGGGAYVMHCRSHETNPYHVGAETRATIEEYQGIPLFGKTIVNYGSPQPKIVVLPSSSPFCNRTTNLPSHPTVGVAVV